MKTFTVKKFAKIRKGNLLLSGDGKFWYAPTFEKNERELMRFAQISIYMNTCNTNPEDCTCEVQEGRVYDITKPSYL